MPSQIYLLGHQMFGLEVLHWGLFIMVAATDSLIINSPFVFPPTLTSPIEEE